MRPNTYEISSLNYKEGYNYYYGSNKKIKKVKKTNKPFKLKSTQIKKINQYLRKNKINLDTNNLFLFLKKAIESREYSKYLFTKSIDLVFKNILKLGRRLNISRDELAFLEINDFLKLYYSLNSYDISEEFKSIIFKNKTEYNLNYPVNLPNIIIDKKDLYFYNDHISKGSFFGTSEIFGEIINLEKIEYKELKQIDLKNKIICISNADPGYDFIFSKGILGLVTCYGGSNSHMSIRCSENITSLIGSGEHNFKKLLIVLK